MTTCIAIALFGEEVSPRFCFAEKALVLSLVQGRETWRHVISLGEPWLAGRIARLATMGVRTLLCGAFNRAYLPSAEHLGIRVVTGVSGNAEEALAKFRREELAEVRACGRRRRRGTAQIASAPSGGRNRGRGCRGRRSLARP